MGEMIRLMEQAGKLQGEKKLDDAISVMKQALAVGEKALGPENLYVAIPLQFLGLLHSSQGKKDLAESFFLRALVIREKAQGREHADVAGILTSLASIYLDKEEFAKAEPLFLRALAIQEKTPGAGDSVVATTLYSLASLYSRKGEYGRAGPLLERALAIYEKAQGPESLYVALTLNNLAFLYAEKGSYERAVPLYLRALAIQEKILGPEDALIATALNNLASLYRTMGDYVRAEPLLKRGLAVAEKALGPEHPDVAISLTSLAILYNDKGDHERALPLFQRALAIREKAFGPEGSTVATTLVNIAYVYNEKKDYAQAEPLYKRALAIHEKVYGPEHPLVATTLGNLAVMYAERGDSAQAEPLLQRALATREKVLGAEHPDVALTLSNLAYLYYLKNEFVREEPLYRRALAISEKALGPEHPTVALYLNNLATVFWGRGDLPQALAFLTRSSEIRERNLALVLTTGSEEQKQRYMQTLSAETDSNVSFHARTAPGDPQAARFALTTVLRRKGRVLDASTDQIGILRRRLNPRDRVLLEQLSAARSELAALVLKGADKLDARQRLAEKARLESEVERLETEVSARSAEFQAQSQPVTLERVQEMIPPRAALVEIVRYRPYNVKARTRDERWGAARYVAYVLRQGGGAPTWADLGEAASIDSAVAELRGALTDPQRTDVKQASRALDERVMRPVRKLLGDTRRLFLSPDGALNLIPFSALVDEQNRYLLENYSITYLTSGRDLLRLQVSAQSKQGPVVIANPLFSGGVVGAGRPTAAEGQESAGNRRSGELSGIKFTPLPGTAGEAKALGAILSGVQLLTGMEATEAALKQVTGPSILHVATHGFFLPDRPQAPPEDVRRLETRGMGLSALPTLPAQGAPGENPLLRSGLALAGVNQRQSGAAEDGVLTALEAAGLDLWGTRLVVLSACETGVGDVKSGDGVYGLRRALVLAGAESQVMSLWQVSDAATRDLMVEYYKRLEAGGGRTEGLREVQLQMLGSKERNHPFFWASFIQSGEWKNLEGKAK